eukprot:768137-Hanusia_phi.AAC.16
MLFLLLTPHSRPPLRLRSRWPHLSVSSPSKKEHAAEPSEPGRVEEGDKVRLSPARGAGDGKEQSCFGPSASLPGASRSHEGERSKPMSAAQLRQVKRKQRGEVEISLEDLLVSHSEG